MNLHQHFKPITVQLTRLPRCLDLGRRDMLDCSRALISRFPARLRQEAPSAFTLDGVHQVLSSVGCFDYDSEQIWLGGST